MKLGAPNFDGIAVMEVKVSFLGPTTSLEAKAAFVNSKTGNTHGSTTCTQWSPATIEALRALRDQMEEDLIRIHFSEDLSSPSTVGGSPFARAMGNKPGGIGEQLNDDGDVPPIG